MQGISVKWVHFKSIKVQKMSVHWSSPPVQSTSPVQWLWTAKTNMSTYYPTNVWTVASQSPRTQHHYALGDYHTVGNFLYGELAQMMNCIPFPLCWLTYSCIHKKHLTRTTAPIPRQKPLTKVCFMHHRRSDIWPSLETDHLAFYVRTENQHTTWQSVSAAHNDSPFIF